MSRVTASAGGVPRRFAFTFDYPGPSHLFVTAGGAPVADRQPIAGGATTIRAGNTGLSALTGPGDGPVSA